MTGMRLFMALGSGALLLTCGLIGGIEGIRHFLLPPKAYVKMIQRRAAAA